MAKMSKKIQAAPTEHTRWLASSISNYEELAKSLITHRGEKGRVIEGIIKSALRTILPQRFNIGTGFAITASGETSTQLDIVIYDGFYNAPIFFDGDIGLFPIECIYGTVEVKSDLTKKEIQRAAEAIKTIRNLAAEKKYIEYGSKEISPGKKIVQENEISAPLPPRAFIVAINSRLGNVQKLETTVAEATKNGAYIHALLVLKKEWTLRQKAYTDVNKFEIHKDRALARFCAAVLDSIQSMDMKPASTRRYLGLVE